MTDLAGCRGGAAALTSSLLVSKGRATAAGFVPPGSLRIAASQPIPFAAHAVNRAKPRGTSSTTQAAPTRKATASGFEDSEFPARVKLSLRLDNERHLRLKLLSAHLRRSSQDLLVEALDGYLAGMAPPSGAASACACLAAGKPAEPGCPEGSGRCPEQDL